LIGSGSDAADKPKLTEDSVIFLKKWLENTATLAGFGCLIPR
jgi:hypothetical protein